MKRFEWHESNSKYILVPKLCNAKGSIVFLMSNGSKLWLSKLFYRLWSKDKFALIAYMREKLERNDINIWYHVPIFQHLRPYRWEFPQEQFRNGAQASNLCKVQFNRDKASMLDQISTGYKLHLILTSLVIRSNQQSAVPGKRKKNRSCYPI